MPVTKESFSRRVQILKSTGSNTRRNRCRAGPVLPYLRNFDRYQMEIKTMVVDDMDLQIDLREHFQSLFPFL
jgi:hypothetical protein